MMLELRLATPLTDNEIVPATTFKEFRARPNTQEAIIYQKFYIKSFLFSSCLKLTSC